MQPGIKIGNVEINRFHLLRILYIASIAVISAGAIRQAANLEAAHSTLAARLEARAAEAEEKARTAEIRLKNAAALGERVAALEKREAQLRTLAEQAEKREKQARAMLEKWFAGAKKAFAAANDVSSLEQLGRLHSDMTSQGIIGERPEITPIPTPEK